MQVINIALFQFYGTIITSKQQKEITMSSSKKSNLIANLAGALNRACNSKVTVEQVNHWFGIDATIDTISRVYSDVKDNTPNRLTVEQVLSAWDATEALNNAPVKYNHAFDLAFAVISEHSDSENIDAVTIRNAINKRLAGLSDEELLEAVGGSFDCHEE